MHTLIHDYHDASCEALNATLAEKLLNLSEQQIIRQTHLFDGRYENIYVDTDQFPELQHILMRAKKYAATLLKRPEQSLKIGCWINIMHQGHTTTLHRHDDADELLSGVYYLRVPDKSGLFVFHVEDEKKQIEPREGHFLFFSPSLLHEVTRHESIEARISIAFNIGPLDPTGDD